MIDNDANVIDHAIYDSYGQLVEETSLATAFQWTGKYRDPLTGLQFNLNRWYNPQLGRWMSEDPIGFAAGDANLGRYVGNEVTGFVDADGREMRPAVGLVNEFEMGRYKYEYFPAIRDGQRGILIHKYDKGAFYDPWATEEFMGSAFVTDGNIRDKNCPPELLQKKLTQQNFLNQMSGLAATTNDTIDAGVTLAAVNIPGPEDVIIAGAARLGYELVKRGGRWLIKVGGRVLQGADEVAAAERIAYRITLERHHNLPQAERFRKYFDAALHPAPADLQ